MSVGTIEQRIRWQIRFRLYCITLPVIVAGLSLVLIAYMSGFQMRGPEWLSAALASFAVGIASLNFLYSWRGRWMRRVIEFEAYRG